MRVYIIGNDGITLCRTAPAAVNNGEIAVASNEELRAAPLSGKRLLALWNALPGVEKRKKVGDRDALIDQLWSGQSYFTRLVRLSYLAPDITQAILDGRQPRDLTPEKLLEHSRLPLAWHAQRIALGFG